MNAATDTSLLVENYPAQRMSLRVAIVTETYPPEINGVATTLARLVRGLQVRGHDVQLVRPRQQQDKLPATGVPATEEVLTKGMPIPKYPHLRMGLPSKKQLVSLWTLRRPDVVHIATEGPLGWSALQAARKLKLPVSSDFRTNFDAYSHHYRLGWLHKPIAAYLRKFHNLADCTLVPTQQLRSALSASGFERLHVVARGIDTAAFDPALRDPVLRREWGVAPGERVALYVGRLAPEKNPQLLASTFNAMLAADPNLTCVVVGDGPSAADIRQACPQARMLGSQTGQMLARCYASADLFIFPSQTETFGNVTLEAMASGLVVVAFDHAAAAEVITHRHNGWLAPLGDDNSFIQTAVSLALDPTSDAVVQQAARATVLARDWTHIVGQVEHIWLGLTQPAHAAVNTRWQAQLT
ncbi:MAG TPA: glycosyltransferase family 1 protein [Burkholderiaceae bacterium]|nr:glycosyltransferase family 1 protein [Burkholderiaceae bacterium]